MKLIKKVSKLAIDGC